MNEFKIIQGLRDLSGNAQLSYLNTIKNELLKDILLYTYDPHKKYKLDGKLDKFTITEGCKEFDVEDWNVFKVLLDYLSNKASATDEEVKQVIDFINKFNQQGQEFCKQVIFKDLRINMGIKKFQKVWPDFCVEPQVQLAEDINDIKVSFTEGMYSRKFDGKRMYVMDNKPYSRSNNLCYIPPVSHILQEINELIGDKEIVLDGECLYFDNGKEDFKKAISLCQSKERKEGCDNVCYVIFDMLPKYNFLTKTPSITFKEEYEQLIELLADETKPTPCYSLIPTRMPHIFIARQDKDSTNLMKLRREHNWEGLMFRNLNSSYEYKRTTNLLKVKDMKDMELKLIGMEEGNGKNEGRLGAFVVEYKDNTVNVGSGFSDELRIEYWNNKDKYIGNYVKVQYFEETIDQNNKPSLRFPVFLSFRDINTNEEFMTK